MLQLEIVTPTKTLDQGEVDYLRCPSPDGLFGLMAGHADAIFAISLGEIKVKKNGKANFFATSGGFADVMDGKVQLLLETIEESAGIDSKRAKDAYERAKNRLSDHKGDEERAKRALSRAKNRLKVSER